MSEKSPNKDIEKSKPETSSGESENRRSSDSRERKMARAAMMEGEKVRKKDDRAGELLKLNSPAIDIVRDHFPEDISPKEHFEHDNGPNPLQTEEDFKKTFDLFLQQELVPVLDTDGKYKLSLPRSFYRCGKTFPRPCRQGIYDNPYGGPLAHRDLYALLRELAGQ